MADPPNLSSAKEAPKDTANAFNPSSCVPEKKNTVSAGPRSGDGEQPAAAEVSADPAGQGAQAEVPPHVYALLPHALHDCVPESVQPPSASYIEDAIVPVVPAAQAYANVRPVVRTVPECKMGATEFGNAGNVGRQIV
jgi:hypothetical protein